MRVLIDILSAIKPTSIVGDQERDLHGLTLDSREVKQGFLFAATRGASTDGHLYISKALEQGASVILCEELPAERGNATYVVVSDAAEALGKLASEYYDNPSSNIQLVGVTGTNGKTSIATMLYQCFMNMGHKCGLLSTIKYSIN
ncbi:MAG: Mur ligase domain-containing protein, partial [Bacteroidia bacterium]|nr:Mur ligase domain-containing protein [Bacteroidia bacterium]